MYFFIAMVADNSGESADESSCEDEVQIPIRHKPVQVRHSLLDNLDESSSMTDQTSNRQKRDDTMVSYMTVM